MAREHSHVKKRRRGCLGGCLTRIVLMLGLAALLFVGAHVLGFVKSDPVTGAPSLTLERLEDFSVGGLSASDLPDFSGVTQGISGGLEDARQMAQGIEIPAWPYGVSREGLTVKTLRAGDGEAVLVCCDGYTMLVGGGSGMGAGLLSQLILCGVKHLNAVIAPCSDAEQIGALALAVTLMPPQYLLVQDSQTKGTAYNRLIGQAQRSEGTQILAAQQGLTFSLGRATVTIIGPTYKPHTDERDDGLSVRVDYGGTGVLIMGQITEAGERELIGSGARLACDALICARGGSESATGSAIVSAAAPSIALMTGREPANSVKVRLQKAGAQVYTAGEHGVMTLVSDGKNLIIKP
ncbi:MAG: hypothetical protein IJN79_02145 [Clostridia bacterium]|nr:hypothetical protein [Clostridia bacterium]